MTIFSTRHFINIFLVLFIWQAKYAIFSKEELIVYRGFRMKKLLPWIKGFFTAFACRTIIGPVLQTGWYEEMVDYYTASVTELIGYYDFVFLLFWFICSVFFIYMSNNSMDKNKKTYPLAFIFAALLPLGLVARDHKTLAVAFGSIVNFTKFSLQLVGFYFFFVCLLGFLSQSILKKNFLGEPGKFFGKHTFLRSFLAIMLGYTPAILLSFPGNLNCDTIGEIMQVTGEMEYSCHHPLTETFFVGGLCSLSEKITGSMTLGLFTYILLQTAMLAAALAFTIYYLSQKKLSGKALAIILGIYIITPVYSNIVSTAIKDVPFMAFVVTYVVMTAMIIDKPDLIENIKFDILYVLVQIFAMLFRNNGLYMLALTGLGLWIYFFKKYDLKKKVIGFLVYVLLAAVLSTVIGKVEAKAVNALPASKGEMLSLPMQIAARYYISYADEMKDGEYEVLAGVLLNPDEALHRYNPDLADQVKTRYIKTASNKEIMDFLILTGKFSLRHPLTFIDATFIHTYGWYCPSTSAEKRYETLADDFMTPVGIWETLDKGMVFLYRYLNAFSLLGALENAGFATWAFLFLCLYQRISNNRKYRIFMVYAGVSLLICFAAPAFLEHTRYGFPILFTVPFLYGLTLSEQ